MNDFEKDLLELCDGSLEMRKKEEIFKAELRSHAARYKEPSKELLEKSQKMMKDNEKCQKEFADFLKKHEMPLEFTLPEIMIASIRKSRELIKV